MPLTNLTGAPGAPALTEFDAQLAGITGLRGVFEAPSKNVVQSGAGLITSVTSRVSGGAAPLTFAANGDGMTPVVREGISAMQITDYMAGPVTDFGDNSVLTLFALFHIPEGEGAGQILGDFSGTRMGIEMGGTSGDLLKLRGRSSATLEQLVAPGWHWAVYQLSGGVGTLRVDSGGNLTGAAAVDGNLFWLGSAVATTIAVRAWGYALAPMIDNGEADIVEDWFRFQIGART